MMMSALLASASSISTSSASSTALMPKFLRRLTDTSANQHLTTSLSEHSDGRMTTIRGAVTPNVSADYRAYYPSSSASSDSLSSSIDESLMSHLNRATYRYSDGTPYPPNSDSGSFISHNSYSSWLPKPRTTATERVATPNPAPAEDTECAAIEREWLAKTGRTPVKVDVIVATESVALARRNHVGRVAYHRRVMHPSHRGRMMWLYATATCD